MSTKGKNKDCTMWMVAGVMLMALIGWRLTSKSKDDVNSTKAAEYYIAPTAVAGPRVTYTESYAGPVTPAEVLGGLGTPIALNDIPQLQSLEVTGHDPQAVYYLQHLTMDRAGIRNIL